MDWCRLWHEMPNDPKWRVIAHRSGRPISEVIAVFVTMMANASDNAEARGRLRNFSAEDVGAALDIEEQAVEDICKAMQGKVLDGDALMGWAKRQPKREDGAAERAKAWRERNRTQANAIERPREEKSREEEKREEREEAPLELPSESALTGVSLAFIAGNSPDEPKERRTGKLGGRTMRIPDDWKPSQELAQFALEHCMTRAEIDHEAEKFLDYWKGKGGKDGCKADWDATWRNWIRRAVETRGQRRQQPAGVVEGFRDLLYQAKDADARDAGAACGGGVEPSRRAIGSR